MSCTFLGNAHYTYLINALRTFSDSKLHGGHARYQALRQQFLPTDSLSERLKLGQLLLDANLKAYQDRYPDYFSKDIDLSQMVYVPADHHVTMSPICVLKQLHCYEYQCSSMDMPLSHHPVSRDFIFPLTCALEGDIGLPVSEVSRTADYQQYPWGV